MWTLATLVTATVLIPTPCDDWTLSAREIEAGRRPENPAPGRRVGCVARVTDAQIGLLKLRSAAMRQSGLVFEIWPFNPGTIISLPLSGVGTPLARAGCSV